MRTDIVYVRGLDRNLTILGFVWWKKGCVGGLDFRAVDKLNKLIGSKATNVGT